MFISYLTNKGAELPPNPTACDCVSPAPIMSIQWLGTGPKQFSRVRVIVYSATIHPSITKNQR